MRIKTMHIKLVAAIAVAALLGACAKSPQDQACQIDPELRAMYSATMDGDVVIPAVPDKYLSQRNKRQLVSYQTKEKPGTIIVDPYARFLYLVTGKGEAMRYGVAVGDQGRGFSGTGTIPFTRSWPRWTPTQNMLKRDPALYEPHRGGMEGGIENPLGARALYLFQNGRDTLYRIHGTNYPWSIGHATSSGCIRLFNQDILDLHDRVKVGAKVVVLSKKDSGQGTHQRAAGDAAPTIWSAAEGGSS